MMDLLPLATGLGLAIGLAFTDLLGITTGGLVVPGYVALYLNQPVVILATLAAAFGTLFLVRTSSLFMILYGRRKTAFMILFGYFLGMLINETTGILEMNYQVIGYIIPGLIAMWMDRQGIVQTLSSLMIVSVLVRLVLILSVGAENLP